MAGQDALLFAHHMLAHLRQLDARAVPLQAKAQGSNAIVGLHDEGVWVPLLRLAAATPKYNKMMLYAPHGRYWAPTLKKGTPQMLAEVLAREFSFLWTIPVNALDPPSSPPSPS